MGFHVSLGECTEVRFREEDSQVLAAGGSAHLSSLDFPRCLLTLEGLRAYLTRGF